MDHTSTVYKKELTDLRDTLMHMGGLVESQLKQVKRIVQQQGSVVNAHIALLEQEINRAQISIDFQCTELIAIRQPVGIDLRRVLASMHIINDLERMGDELKKCATWGQELNEHAEMGKMRRASLFSMLEVLETMLALVLTALAREDAAQAQEVFSLDLSLDNFFADTVRAQQAYMNSNPGLSRYCLDIIFMAKSFERVGDHAKNIAEAIGAIISGVDTRHQINQTKQTN
ncbi:MAG: Phosphate-specific transport system accessory protein PhoU [Pseudomonadota bacterium]|jgi:phosphate transport system protein